MIIDFNKDYLRELYVNSEIENWKHDMRPSVIQKYIQTIDKLKAANCIEELYPIKSIDYKIPLGNEEGLETVRINNEYRIEFKTKKSMYRQITICIIINITNNY